MFKVKDRVTLRLSAYVYCTVKVRATLRLSDHMQGPVNWLHAYLVRRYQELQEAKRGYLKQQI